MHLTACHCSYSSSLATFSRHADAALTITLDFTDFNSMAPATADLDTILRNDGWTGATTNATKLAAARAVMEEAADQIEAVFASVPETLRK